MNGNREITDFLSRDEFEKIREFSKGRQTPFVLLNLRKIGEKYEDLKRMMPFAKIYYAVKANPCMEVLELLSKKGSNFDVATVYEMDQVMSLGIGPERISFGNTIKKEKDIEYAYKKGIRLFVTDSDSDMKKISRAAPGSRVFFRILCDGSGADWPLSRKFGAYPDSTYKLIIEAKKLGLEPYGLSFHVGSQQRDVGQWDNAIAQCKYLFESVKAKGIELKMINIGGGFPSNYIQPTEPIETYTNEITRFLNEDFPEGLPEIFVEPGRSLVADAGVLVTEIIMISKKGSASQYPWMYLDIGKFGGLIETLDEAIKYPIFSDNCNSGKLKEFILAGPTCDSYDVLYENFRYHLPSCLKEGDRVYILTAGAYTYSYSSICFNGIPPLKVYIVEE